MIALLKQIAKDLLFAVLLDTVVRAVEKELDARVRAIVLGEITELYSHLLTVEECVSLVGHRLNRMQEGLRVLGNDGAAATERQP